MVADVPKVGVGASLELEDAEETCLLVWALSLIDDDISSIAGLVRCTNSTSEVRSAGRLAAIGIWPLSDVRGCGY